MLRERITAVGESAALRATDDQIIALLLAMAAGQISRQDVEQWFAQWVVANQEPSA